MGMLRKIRDVWSHFAGNPSNLVVEVHRDSVVELPRIFEDAFEKHPVGTHGERGCEPGVGEEFLQCPGGRENARIAKGL